ncbi:MAG: DEAD/DEAH box helicase [Micrococcales bacterium]|nr:DEAD/DEAH box helicase [Micrococcales bacterium]
MTSTTACSSHSAPIPAGGSATGSAADPTPAPGPILDSERRAVADRVLTALAGPDAHLRPDQERAVAALLEPGARALVVQATGWGKSAVYWVATALRRAQGAGPSLVVSPLLALMRDQVAAARRAGLRAYTVNSGNIGQWSTIEAALAADEVDVLLVSPERLANPGFGTRVLHALADRLGLLVVDEAHAVSDWGHDFRPDYRRVADVLRELHPDTPVLATTATANARVTADVAAQLGPATLILRGALARSSLELVTLPPMTPVQRYAWVAEHLPSLPGSGIVYVLTIADAERLVEAIRAVHGVDYPVAAYSGRLDVGDRERLEDDLRDNRVKALVATSALGMGYDKPDLGFVVHVGAPPSPVTYYQQVGRAGRAIDHALVALLPSGADAGIWEHYATSTLPDPQQCERLLAALSVTTEAGQAVSVVQLEASTGIRRGRVELMLKQLAVDQAVDRRADGWVRTGRQWAYDEAHYDGILAVRRREADIMRRYLAGRDCLMQLLQSALDDPAARPCGRCSVCRGALPATVNASASAEVVATVTRCLRGQPLVLDPRKMWPGGAFGARGRIPSALAAQQGRVLVHADAPEWQSVIEGCLRVDGEPPAGLLEAAVATLVEWSGSWAQRPAVALDLAAGGLPCVVSAVTDHLATVGRLERARLSVRAPAALPRDAGGAQEAAGWREAFAAASLPVAQIADRSVLLVVDATSSQWPITVAAAALREAGATQVLPLLVHRLP